MKKNLFSFILLFLMGLGAAQAYDFSAVAPSGQTLYYNISGSTVTVTTQNSTYPYYSTVPTGTLTIPSSVTYNSTTYTVTHIGNYAFYGCSGLTSVTIPDSVTSIGDSAFYNCSGLTSVTIPNTVTSIGNFAFHYCSGLTSVTIPNSVTSIGQSAFTSCSGLTSITIPNSVTSIGQSAFYNCSGLTSVTIPNSVASIGYYAFGNCTRLTTLNFNADSCVCTFPGPFNSCDSLHTVTFGNNVKVIPANLLYNCTGITSVTIPDSVTRIGTRAFANCSRLTTLNFNADSCVIERVNYQLLPFFGCDSLRTVTFGNNVKVIPDMLLNNCTRLSSVTIGNSVTHIGYSAFAGCSGLTSVTIPNSVTNIGSSAFYGCSGLTSVTIPNSVTNIGNNAFYGCSGLTSVIIGNSVDSIGQNAFSNCVRLYTLDFNADSCVCTFRGSGPFSSCDSLHTVTFGNNVKVIPAYLLYNCSGLTSVTIGNSVTNIGNRAFSGCNGLTTLNFNADSCVSVDNISSNSAFYGCDSIRTVTFGNNVKVIPAYLLYNCIRLTSITIPNSVTRIETEAFYGCSGLTSVTIGNSVTNIGSYAFYGCSGLTTLNFNADSCVSATFSSCDNLRTVTFGSNVMVIPSSLLSGCRGLTSVTIPNSVTSIGNNAFYNCSGLTSVTIPNTVTNIGNDAFYLVRHIEYYGTATGSPWGALSMNVVTDGDFIYSDSTRTHLLLYIGTGGAVTIPNSVARIGTDAFYNCSGLMSVSIPNFVTRIDNHAFHNCSGLTTLNFNADSCVFAGISHDSCAFYGCDSIATVNFGNNVRVIPPYLLYNCTRLTSVTIPDSVTTIGNQAFVGCSSLASVSIPSSITSIGSNAFYDCSKLTSVIFRQGTGTADTITVNSADTTMGTGCVFQVRPNGVTVSAMRKIGYWFSHWSDGSQENPHAVGATSGTLTAHFTTTRPQSSCPGLKNPAAFTDGSTTGQYIGYYSGQTGNKPYQQPVAPNITGMNMTGQEYSGNELASLASSQSTAYCGTTLESGKRFRIMSAFEGPGTDANMGKDPLTGYGLPYVPPVSVTDGAVFTSSIRIGNCQTGAEAEGLYYTMTVRPQNTLMTLYFAIVVQAPGHGYAQDPTFCIRVCRNTGTDANPVWTPISDTLAYFVPTTGLQNNVNGWHQIGSGTGTNTIMWREWNKASVNVCKYMYEKIRVEVYMSDCAPHGHYGYCYVAGDCQPMFIQTSGCPAGSAARVQTLMAPSGLEGYVWYRSDNDGLEIPNETIPPSTINFRRLTPNSGNTSNNYIYDCTVQDFYCHAGAHAGQYTNNMVFRCDMKTALDPTKPYWMSAYIRVINNKPMMSIDTMRVCEPWMQLTNRSYVPGDLTGCDTSISEWTFYAGPDTTSAILTRDTGGIAEYTFSDTGRYAVRVRSFNRQDHTCYTDSLLTFGVTEVWDILFNLSSANTAMGEVEVLSQPTCQDSIAVFRAIPYEGYHFVRWDDGDTTNPRTLVVTQDTCFVAFFSEDNDTTGIREAEGDYDNFRVFAHGGQIVIEGAEGNTVNLYDATGRILATKQDDHDPLYFDVPATGTYLVRVGNYPARRIVIVK